MQPNTKDTHTSPQTGQDNTKSDFCEDMPLQEKLLMRLAGTGEKVYIPEMEAVRLIIQGKAECV